MTVLRKEFRSTARQHWSCSAWWWSAAAARARRRPPHPRRTPGASHSPCSWTRPIDGEPNVEYLSSADAAAAEDTLLETLNRPGGAP